MAAKKPAAHHPEEPGFDVEAIETELELVFTDPAYSGLRIRMREPSGGQLADMLRIAPGNSDTRPTAAQADTLFDLIADGLISWNARRLGAPIPATDEGIRSMGIMFTMRLLDAWLAAADTFVSARSTDEQPLEITSLPMSD